MTKKHLSEEERDREWFRNRFPTAKARIAADKAVDLVPLHAPMTDAIDVWIATYRAEGGLEPVGED